jgi:PD-(D/E)XK endonuclease
VAVPFGVARYDLIVDVGSGLKRVQCKTGRLRNGVIVFNAYSSNRSGIRGYQGEADFFGVYCRETDKVYMVPVTDTKTQLYLRVSPSKNGQLTGIKYAVDYEIHAVVAQW